MAIIKEKLLYYLELEPEEITVQLIAPNLG